MRLIQKMKPQTKVKKKNKKKRKKGEEWEEKADNDVELKKKQFPGLAMPNDYSVRVSGDVLKRLCVFGALIK